MTDFVEVHERDGAARLAELRLADAVTTPALVTDVDDERLADVDAVHGILRDAGSLWPGEQTIPDGSDATLTILPHRAFPSGTPDEVQDAFAVDPDPDAVDGPTAAVVSPETATNHGTDAYVLAGAPGFVGHASAFVDAVVGTREAIPADTALYLPGVATPRNAATLLYAGVDLLDADRAVVRGTQGRYLTTEGEYDLDRLDELPCACAACAAAIAEGGIEAFDRADCVEHNVAVLAAEVARVRQRIRHGRLRDYLEGQVRQANWCTATMRRLDQQYAYLEERTPVIRSADLDAATEDTIRRVEIQRFAERVTTRYRSRFSEQPLVLVPCSAYKPYSESKSHRRFHDAIQFRGHTVSMTSPIGVVPQELELTYPAQHYDTVVTGEWSANELEFVAEVLGAYLARNDYPELIAHVPSEGYREICDRVANEHGVEFTDTVEGHPTDGDSLGNLAGALEGYPKYQKRERQHNTLRAVADYQFGDGAGDDLFPDLRAGGRYPQLRAHDGDDEQLAALTGRYGVLALTLAGARRWVDSDVPTKTVEIEPFVPHGSVLAPGIVDASDDVRVGDEVVIRGEAAFGVGRAQMSGPEMVESTRGIACEVRHVEER